LDNQALQGSSALGFIAYATPDRLEVDPGDGSAKFKCTWVTKKSNLCKYRYPRSSLDGPVLGLNGAPAYKATVTAWWTLRFEVNGAKRPVAGAPAELSGDEAIAHVVVVEVQTIVTSAG
jgi:hypothetical protein